MSHVSRHAQERIRERIGVGKKGAARQAELAFERGLSHGDTQGQLYKWVTSRVLRYSPYPTVRLFNMKLFIFSHKDEDLSTLITVVPVPSNLHKQVSAQLKRNKDSTD